MVYRALTKDSSVWFKAVISWQWKHSILTQWHTKKNTKPVIQDPNIFFCVCDADKMTGLQEYADWFLYSTDLDMESRALTVYSTTVGMPIATAVVVVLFFVLFVINFLKSLCFLLCCQLCASLKNFFFVPFAILVVQFSFEHKEMHWGIDTVRFVRCKKRKLFCFMLVIPQSTTQLLLLCMFAVFPNRSTS